MAFVLQFDPLPQDLADLIQHDDISAGRDSARHRRRRSVPIMTETAARRLQDSGVKPNSPATSAERRLGAVFHRFSLHRAASFEPFQT
jgi:hypothetical protein